MKILITTGVYPPDIGGPATYTKTINDELSIYKIESDVLCFKEVRRLPFGFRHFVYLIKARYRARNCDLLYAQDPVSVGLPTAIAARLSGKKYILKVVGDYAWEQGVSRFSVSDSLLPFSKKHDAYQWQVRVLKKIQELVANRAEVVIVPSEYLRRVVINWGVQENRIKVVYNGIEKMEDIPEKDTLRQVLKFGGKLLISAGRLVPWKGFPVLIEAVSELKKKYPDIKLLIVGSGPCQNEIENLIYELGLKNNVVMTGSLDRNILLRYIKASDIFVLNSAYEGLSHQLLEVMSLGVPIVTTHAGGNKEIIADGINGILVPHNNTTHIVNAVKRLFNSMALRKKITAAGLKRVEEFSTEKMVKETANIINQLS